MTRRLLLSYLSLTVLVLVVLEVPLGIVFARSERTDLLARVKQDTLVIALSAEEPLERGDSAGLDKIVNGYRDEIGGRVVIVNRAGNVVADSSGPAARGSSYANRPEISAALGGRTATGWRHSKTISGELLFAAVPTTAAGAVTGAVRVTYPGAVVARRIRRSWEALAGVAATMMLLVALASLRLARGVTGPLRDLAFAAARIGAGDLATRAVESRGPPEVAHLARTLNDMARRIEALVTSQQAFVADASHELRTPLAALRLRLENLEAELPKAAAADVEGALIEVRRLGRMVDGLLALARAEQGATAPESVDACAVIDARRQIWQPLAEERSVTITVVPTAPLFVLVTPGRLEQVLDNLLANALDAAERTVALHAERAGPVVDIHVIDDGAGMTPEQRHRAFDRFWRAASARPAGAGTGLGLAIVHQLLISDGGDISLSDASPHGLDVRVRLRATDRQPEPERPETDRSQRAS